MRVEPKVMGVLECLAERPGRTIPKSTFMNRVWEGTVVTDDVLARCVSQIRKVFDDDPKDPVYIETIRKRGYRLIAEVRAADPDPGPLAARPAPSSAQPPPAAPLNGQHAPTAPASRTTDPLSAAHRLLAPFAARPRVTIVALTLAVLLGGLIGIYATRSSVVPPPRTVPLTSFPGEEIDPAISPDGEQLVFARTPSGGQNYDLFIKQTGTETPVQLTDDPAEDRSPTWSPDGRQIAFTRTLDGSTRIMLMPFPGDTERELLDLSSVRVRSMVWSPTGRHLALSAQRTPNEPFRVLLLDVEGLDMTQLTFPPAFYRGDVDLAFSPDGDQLAFVRSVVEGNEDVHVVTLAGGASRRLTYDHAELTGIDWTSDGRSIVFASNREGSSSLWRLPLTGGTPTWIATAGKGGRLQQPSIARNAARLTYAERLLDTNIWQIRRSGDRERRLIFSTRWDSHPQLSPDETRVAFASERSGSHQIWVADRDGSNPVQLTSEEQGVVGTPRWSPDSRQIVFEARRGPNADIYVMDAGGSGLTQLTTHEDDDVAPSWSRDTSAVYFASNRTGDWQIYKLPVDRKPTDAAQQVTQNGGIAAFDSPDGSSLFFVKGDTTGIWELSLIDVRERQVVPDLQPFDWGNWGVAEHGIYYLRRGEEQDDIAFYSFATGKTWRILSVPDVPEHPSFTVSRDGEWFIYTRVDRSESDILLVNDFQ